MPKKRVAFILIIRLSRDLTVALIWIISRPHLRVGLSNSVQGIRALETCSFLRVHAVPDFAVCSHTVRAYCKIVITA